MAADLGLVAHTADGDAHERTAQRARDRLAERRLADAGRTDQTEDRTDAAPARRCRGRARGATRAPPGTRGCGPSRRSSLRGRRRARHALRRGRCALGRTRPTATRRPRRASCAPMPVRGSARPSARSGRAPCRPRARTASGRFLSANFARYSATMSSSLSPSSLRIASIWRRSNISRCCLSRSSVTLVADLVLQLQVGESLARPRRARVPVALPRRPSRAARRAAPWSARASRPRCRPAGRGRRRRRARRRCGARRGARGSSRRPRGTRAPARGRGRTARARRSVRPATCRAPCAPISPVPIRTRPTPRITSAWVPFGQVARTLDLRDRADRREPAVEPGHEHHPVGRRAAAAAPARFASSVSSAIVTTIWGSTTPCVRGSRGSS